MAKSNSRIPELGSFQAIKLGSGVLGKTSPIVGALVAFATVVVLALRNADPLIIVGIFSSILLAVVAYVIGALWYGSKYPAEALLEGGELVKYRELALATNDPAIIDITPEASKNVAPPDNFQSGGPK